MNTMTDLSHPVPLLESSVHGYPGRNAANAVEIPELIGSRRAPLPAGRAHVLEEA